MDLPVLSVCFCTLGCRLNQLETEEIAAAFRAEGFAPASFNEAEADAAAFLCIINTCAVTAKAEQKARRVIRQALRHAGFAAVIVTGCYAETDAQKIAHIIEESCKEDERLARLVILPGKQKDRLKRLPAALRHLMEENDVAAIPSLGEINAAVRSFCAGDAAGEISGSAGLSSLKAFKPVAEGRGDALFSFHSRALIKIQEGCSNACTFCKTRIARGPSVSVPSTEIIARARQIEASGQAEVVLTGVNLSQYRDPITGCGLAGLLAILLERTERVFIRISSLYPESVAEDFATAIANERVCPFFHLSIQSGSEKILRLMGRSYTAQDVLEGVRLLRSAKENPFISCDIITGFPGEADEDFRQTEVLCKEIDFAHIHVFPFSPREGTAAAAMKARVLERVSRERAARLIELSREGRRRYIALWEGKTLAGALEYSSETGKARVFTVNALSLPLEYSSYIMAGGEAAQALREAPERLRGVAILAKVRGNGDNPLNFSAELKDFLFKS